MGTFEDFYRLLLVLYCKGIEVGDVLGAQPITRQHLFDADIINRYREKSQQIAEEGHTKCGAVNTTQTP